MDYAQSPFRDLESYLRFVVGLAETYIQLTLQQFNSNFVTYEVIPAIYSINDFSEVVQTKSDHDGTIQIDFDDITMKAKPILNRFGGSFGTLRVDEKSSFFIGFFTILEF